MTVPAVRTTYLTKMYRRRRDTPRIVVDRLDLTMQPGQVLGLLGVNGAGKTTSIKMICGLVEPTAGRVEINGVNIRTSRRRAMRDIGVVLEGTRNIYWPLSPMENLRYFAALKGVRAAEQRERAERLLTELLLWDRKDDPVGGLSRGMQQKVAIACALISDPSIVLLDEPTLGLDVEASRTVREWVDKLAHVEGKSVLLTSHQLDLVQDLCDHIAVVHGGRLVVNEPTDELLSRFRVDTYRIVLDGRVGLGDLACYGLNVEPVDGGVTLSGAIPDQALLYRILEDARALGLDIVSVRRVDPSLEDVFLETVQSKLAVARPLLPVPPEDLSINDEEGGRR